MIKFTISEPTLRTQCLFLLNCGPDEVHNLLLKSHRINQEIDTDACGSLFTFSSSPYRVVWCEQSDLDCLSHEIFHLVTRICNDKGIRIISHDSEGYCGDETAAYLFEFYFGSAVRELKKRKVELKVSRKA